MNSFPDKLLSRGAWLIAVVAAFGFGRWSLKSEESSLVVAGGVTSMEAGEHFSPPGAEGSLEAQTAGTEADEAAGVQGGPQPMTTREIVSLASEAVSDPSPLARSLAMAKLLESLTAENALSVMAALEENRADGDDWKLFRYAWASIDPEGAMTHALGLEGRSKRDALEDTITGWASQSPVDAMAWVDALEDKGDRERYRNRLVDGMADHDIGQATDYVMQLAEQGDKRAGRYLEMVTREQLRKVPVQDAARWAETLADGKLKGQAMDRVAGRFVSEDPVAAAAWAEKFTGEDYAARVIEEVGDEWAERDPSAAVSWLQSLPGGEGQSEGMESALGEWARRDPTAASEYLVEMSDSPLKDAAVSGFARRIVREDPEAAMAWAGTINQADMRLETMTNAAKEWIKRDNQAATTWLETSNLPTATLEAILKSLKRRG